MAIYKTFRSIKLRKKDEYHTLMLLTSISLDIEQFGQDVKELEKQLLEDNVGPCKLLIDQLLTRRSQDLRFLEIEFNGKNLLADSVKYVKIPQEHCVREHACRTLAKNKKMLNESFLKKTQKRQILRGEII